MPPPVDEPMTPPPALADQLPALLRFARSLTRDAGAADDLVQDAVVRALERHDRFDPSRDYRAWLFTLTHNLFVDGWRRRRVHDVAMTAMGQGRDSGIAPSQEQTVMLRQALQSFDALPAEQRAVMHLVVVEGASYAEAAEILGVAIGTIMSRLSRARQTLREPVGSQPTGHLRLVSDRDA